MPADSDGTDTRRIIIIVVAAVAAVTVAVIVTVIALVGGSDDITIDTTTTAPAATTTTTLVATTIAETTTTAEATTTVVETTTTTAATTTTAPLDPALFEVAVWPWVDSNLRYDDPIEAARGFAVDYVGFVEPIVGEFRQGDQRSGEVEIRAFASGQPTTVLVRQLADQTWWVLGAQSPNIVVSSPASGSRLGTTLRVAGRSLSFDGTVDFLIRADGSPTPLFDGFVTGGATPGAIAPFDASFTWSPPPTGRGTIVFQSRSPDDGRIVDATVVRVGFA